MDIQKPKIECIRFIDSRTNREDVSEILSSLFAWGNILAEANILTPEFFHIINDLIKRCRRKLTLLYMEKHGMRQ